MDNLYYVSAYRYDADGALLGYVGIDVPMSYSDARAEAYSLKHGDPIHYDAARLDVRVAAFPCDCGNDATVRLSDTFAVCASCA